MKDNWAFSVGLNYGSENPLPLIESRQEPRTQTMAFQSRPEWLANVPPLVSYVVASYNHKPYVRQAIESILAQDYPRIELIVVDDGSTDGSADLLKELRDIRGFNLIEQSNSGIVASLNRGLGEATGEFMTFP